MADTAISRQLQTSRPKKKKARASLRSLLVLSILIFVVYPVIVLNYYYVASSSSGSGKKMSHHIRDHPLLLLPKKYSNDSHIKVGSGDESLEPSLISEKNRERAPPRKSTDCVVYLAQFGNHSSYGAQYTTQNGTSKQKVVAMTGLYKLNKSLDLLYTNYVNDFPTVDVIIFYDSANAPEDETIKALQCCNRKDTLQFRVLDKKWWSLPYGLQGWQHMLWSRPAFSIGYRLMMRWYAVLIWKYLDAEGYTHVVRLDDDSYILSKIHYNMFDYVREHKIRYGFRMPVRESDDNFDKLIDRYLIDHGKDTSKQLVDLYNKDRGIGFYNNFFMADVKFFASPPASTLLQIIDESKLIFEKRTGDLVIQSAVVRLLLDPSEIHWFRDFTYEHMTICRREKCGPMIPKGYDLCSDICILNLIFCSYH